MAHEFMEDRVRHELPWLAQEESRDLARVVERLVAFFHPECIYVFGSQARGEATPDSDFDLLIILSAADGPEYRLDQQAFRAAGEHSIALDILVMGRAEFERRSRAVASLPATVLREGRALYAA